MKKVIYILNLLFLTLSVFGGSVFAANTPPTQYIDTDGSVEDVPSGIVNLYDVANGNSNNALSEGWYYIDQSITKTSANIYVQKGADVSIVVAGSNPVITFTTRGAIYVPSDGSLSFYAAADAGGNITTNNLTITGSGSNTGFVIGNYTHGKDVFDYASSDFGDITFNSGSYTLVGAKTGTSVGIGSPDSGGGTVTINPEAVVKYSDSNNGSAISVPQGKGCNLEVNSGLFDCTVDNRKYAFGINVGTGSVKISGQGKILSLTDPTDWKNLTITSGIIGFGEGGLGGNSAMVSSWNAFVGGEVVLPPGDLQQNMDPPTGSVNYNQWNSITINPGAELTLNTTTSTNGTSQSALFKVGYDADSAVNNFGKVTINGISQAGTYPYSWNNYEGSSLTIAATQTLTVGSKGFINYDADSGQSAGQVTVNGTLNLADSGGFTNGGNLTIAQGGKITGVNPDNNTVTGAGDVVNNQSGTVNLDGEIIFTPSNNCFQNSGSVNVDPSVL